MSAQDQRGDESSQQITRAQFRVIGPGAAGQPIPVNFNPESLEYTVTNNIKEEGNSTENKQQVSKSSGKLSMELVFDTTLAGDDVREQTEKLQALMKPSEEGSKKIAPVVEFAWGTYRFKGIFTSYKETLDFFSATGVPLRASISITMTQQDGLFEPTAKGDAVTVDDGETFEPAGDASSDDNSGKGPATGDPQTDRELAEDNDEDNPRFFTGKPLSVSVGPNLLPAAAFATGGLSLGVSAGIGLDVGFSAGVSAGVGIGLGIEAGIDVGLSASFGVDIGVDISFEASVSVGASVDVSLGAGVGVGVGAGAGAGLDAGVSASSDIGAGSLAGASASGTGFGTAGALPAGVSGGSATGSAAAAAGFGGGEFSRSGPTAAVRTRSRGPDATSPGDALFDELVVGPRFGGNASAGVPAALGAFAGLLPVGPRRRRPVMLSKLRASRPERDLRTDTGASFEIGGQAIDRSPNGLGADVGARASLAERIAFDDPIGDG